MTEERLPYDQMVAMLEPVIKSVRDSLTDNVKFQRQWTKERRAHLEANGWTDESFIQEMWRQRRARFKEKPSSSATSPSARAGAPLPAMPVRKTPPPKPEPLPTAQVPPQKGSNPVQAWYNLADYKGTPVTYTSRNRRHEIAWGQGFECTITCFNERTKERYWSSAVAIGPNTRVVDAVRNARAGAK